MKRTGNQRIGAHSQTLRQREGEKEREKDDQTTRQRLLEVAGHVFAEKGFDRTTGKEICERAGINTAAVNYYYGGIEGLYTAVVEEAHNRFVTFADAAAAIAGKTDARSKLEAILELIVRAIVGPTLSSWDLRVIGREVVAPSPVLAVLRDTEFLPKTRILKSIVSELMGLPPDHPAVARGCISVMAPCFMLLIFDRDTLKRAFPGLALGPDDAAALVRHMVQYALAGLGAVARG
jgi:AcrR family transcriptional regulator